MGLTHIRITPGRRGVLPHEQTMPERVNRLAAAWMRDGAVQETPVLLLPAEDARWVVADGHHRLAAARRIAEATGGQVTIAAEIVRKPAILPAHRIIHAAPEGWIETLRAALARKLGRGNGPLSIVWQGGAEGYGGEGMEAMRALGEAWGADPPEPVWSIEGERDTAIRRLAEGARAVIFVPGFELRDVMDAAQSGRLFPPRSTNFQPKPAESSIRFPIQSGNRRLFERGHLGI